MTGDSLLADQYTGSVGLTDLAQFKLVTSNLSPGKDKNKKLSVKEALDLRAWWRPTRGHAQIEDKFPHPAVRNFSIISDQSSGGHILWEKQWLCALKTAQFCYPLIR